MALCTPLSSTPTVSLLLLAVLLASDLALLLAVARLMVAGLFVVFLPLLALFQAKGFFTHGDKGLLCIWGAKAAMNAWRLVGLARAVHSVA